MTTYVEVGTCSACAGVAKSDADGNWWHVGPSCLPPNVRSLEVQFVSTSGESKPESKPEGADTAARRKARDVADRQQRNAPADRGVPGSETQR